MFTEKTKHIDLAWIGYFLLFQVPWVSAIALINAHSLHVSESFPYLTLFAKLLLMSFTWLTALGHMSVISILPLACILIPLYCLFPYRKLMLFTSSLLSTIMLMLLLADHFVFSIYRFHLQGVFVNLLLNSEGIKILALSNFEIYLVIILTLLIFLIQLTVAILLWRKPIHRSSRPAFFILATCALFSYFIQLCAFANTSENPSILITCSAFSQQARAFPLYNQVLFHLLPKRYSLESIMSSGSGIIRQPTKQIHHLHYPKQALQVKSSKKPLNLLIIAIDAWRYDSLNKKLMPHLYQFSKSSWRFMNHLSGGNVTRDGIFSLFYGLPSTYWSSVLASKTPPVLLSMLDKLNYQHLILGSAPLNIPEFNQSVFSLWPDIKTHSPGDTPALRDKYITDQLVDFLDQHHPKDKPFVAFAFYDTAHSYCKDNDIPQPFKPAIKTCRRVLLTNSSDPVPYHNRYNNALQYVDSQIHRVLKRLQSKHLLEDTLVLVTADHGEEFNDNHLNYWGHGNNFTDQQVKVPLLIHWPSSQQHVFQHNTQHADIAPSLIHWLTQDKTPIHAYSIGQLLTQKRARTFYIIGSYVGYGIRTADLTMKIYSDGNYELFDAQSRLLQDRHFDRNLLTDAFQQTQAFYH